MSAVMQTDLIQIGGADPAGLAAAITLAKAGIGTAFTAKAYSRADVFDAWGTRYEIEGNKTFFYLVERGPGPGTLDSALLEQARGLGVEVRFNSRLDHLEGAGILATGPRAADAIAVGYHFETPMDDGVWVILDDELAPQGHAYLLVMNGRGTVKSCMFSGFKQEHVYVERTVAAFQRLTGLEMVNPVAHGGVGNFHIPARALTGVHPVVGEEAGFQDFLWGFGMRHAILSGVLAARSVIEGKDYDKSWRRELEPPMWNSMINRALFGLLGNRGYRWLLQRSQAQHWDAHRALHAIYQPWPIKRLLLPWARRRYNPQRRDENCDHINCTCVWCRHCGHRIADAQKTCGS